MSKCEEMQALISAMLDGELSEGETARVQAHIAACDDCRAMYDAFTAVSAAVAADAAQEVPDGLHEKIMSTVKAADRAMRTQHRLKQWRGALTAAACLVVVVGTVFALGSTMFGRMGSSKAGGNAAPMAPGIKNELSGGTAPAAAYSQAADKADAVVSAANGSVTADCAVTESVECEPGLAAAEDEADGVPAEMPSAASAPADDGLALTGGTAAQLQKMVVEITEVTGGGLEYSFIGVVESCSGQVFAKGDTVSVVVKEVEPYNAFCGDWTRVEVDFDRWEDGIVYAYHVEKAE